MERVIKLAGVLTSLVLITLALGFSSFAFQKSGESWVRDLYPWQDGAFTFIFLASVFVAIGFPILWIMLSEEFGAILGGAIDLTLTCGGLTFFSFQQYAAHGDSKVWVLGLLSLYGLIVSGGLLWWSRGYPIRDKRAMPPLVRISFAVFSSILIVVGLALILKVDNVMPWIVRNEASSVIYGWIFLGAATYFGHGVLRPSWHNARGQLIGFLAYDLVLILPFMVQFEKIPPDLKDSLILYTIVVVYSGLLAIYYLFIDEKTSAWAIQEK